MGRNDDDDCLASSVSSRLRFFDVPVLVLFAGEAFILCRSFNPATYQGEYPR
jgi:hypothetical protein